MDNRFGLKDFVLFALVIVLIVMVWLSMLQRDRMWPKLEALEEAVQNQTRDLASIRRQLSQGVVVAGGGAGSTTQASDDPFAIVAAAERMPGFARGDWLIDNFGTKVPKLTPLISQDVYGSIVQNRVQESLGYRDPYSLEYVPLLARSWQASSDGMKYTFQLRPGVTFSDGVPLTAHDIVFTYN